MSQSRQLSAIMHACLPAGRFTDIVGFTALRSFANN